MIDFRYHLVSIIAVFLALAVGLLVGATALSGESLNVLNHAHAAVVARNTALTNANKLLQLQVAADQAFAQAGTEPLLGRLLTGDDVVLVIAPNQNNSVVSGVIAALGQAGAKVTGQIQLSQQFMQTTGPAEASLAQLAQNLAPKAGLTLPAPSNQAVAGQQDAAAVIAASVLTKDGGGLAAADSQAILNGFAQNGYLSVSPSGTTAPPTATLAVLVTPDGPPPQTGNTSQVLVAVAQELQAAGSGTVMAGSISAIGPGSAIVLENGASSGQVSTVDYADTESGQIMVVQALRLLLDGKAPQAYGVGPGTAPSPAPTPSVSVSVSVSPSPSSSAGAHR